MINYNISQYQNSTSINDLIECQCSYCKQTYYKTRKTLYQVIWAKQKNIYCSVECMGKAVTKAKQVQCKECNKYFIKSFAEIKKSISHFCSSSCAATYNNNHKTYGIRRSKLEIWLETQLINLFPDIDFLFNDKTAIESELDIYIPSLKLAFELNGIFHYEPIFGKERLEKITNNDEKKFQKCIEKNISLCIIDTSQQKYFKEKSSQKYLDIIVNIIKENF